MPLAAAKRLFRRSGDYPAAGVIAKGKHGNHQVLRFSWVWTTASHPDANLGDALSAVMVAAISQMRIERAGFDTNTERLAAVGTIGHAFHSGKVHLWGTGFDMARDRHGALNGYTVPDETDLVIHAVRGRETAEALRSHGLTVPETYGDPVWFLPKIFPDPNSKTHELGVIVHISELDAPTAASLVRASIERYRIPPELARDIKIINTYTSATIEGLKAKTEEILSCRRILSTSLHGLVIAEAYGIPCAWFASHAGQAGRLPLNGAHSIDHRMRDFYSGVDRDYVLSYLQPPKQQTDWQEAIRFLDDHWLPLSYTGEGLFNSFPLKARVPFRKKAWNDGNGVFSQIPL